MSRITPLRRSVRRRVEKGLVVELRKGGVAIRGRRRRRWRMFTWEQVLSLDPDPETLTAQAEINAGARVLAELASSEEGATE